MLRLSQMLFIHELHEFTRILYSENQQDEKMKSLYLVLIRVIRGLLRQSRDMMARLTCRDITNEVQPRPNGGENK